MTVDASSSARLPGRFRLPGLLVPALVLALLYLSTPGIFFQTPANAAGAGKAETAGKGKAGKGKAETAGKDAANAAEAAASDEAGENAAQGDYHSITGSAEPAKEPAKAAPDKAASDKAAPDKAAPDAQAEASAKKPALVRLFGTVEFRSPVKNLPKWERVRDAENKRPSFISDGLDSQNKAVSERWIKLKEKLKDQPLKEQVQRVNNFFNQWPYKTDLEVWGVEDYWATPREFVIKSGDCEDYAISKYYALRDLGVPVDYLRIAAVKDTIRGIGHAVGIVFMENDAYVLDNLTNLVLSHKKLRHYAPQYSVNEQYLWRHVQPKAGGK